MFVRFRAPDRDRPLPARRSELTTTVEKAVGPLTLDAVVERREEDGALPPGFRSQRNPPGSTEVAVPLQPETPRPFRCVAEPIAGHIARDTAHPDGDVSIVSRCQPRQMSSGVQGVRDSRRALQLDAADRRLGRIRNVDHAGPDRRLHLQIGVVGVKGGHIDLARPPRTIVFSPPS